VSSSNPDPTPKHEPVIDHQGEQLGHDDILPLFRPMEAQGPPYVSSETPTVLALVLMGLTSIVLAWALSQVWALLGAFHWAWMGILHGMVVPLITTGAICSAGYIGKNRSAGLAMGGPVFFTMLVYAGDAVPASFRAEPGLWWVITFMAVILSAAGGFMTYWYGVFCEKCNMWMDEVSVVEDNLSVAYCRKCREGYKVIYFKQRYTFNAEPRETVYRGSTIKISKDEVQELLVRSGARRTSTG
jgi:hypothetical protein